MGKITEKEILEEAKKIFSERNARVPTTEDWKKESKIHLSNIFVFFKKYKDLWHKLGIKYDSNVSSQKRQYIMDNLKIAFSKDKNTTIGKLIRSAGLTRPTINKYFGSVKLALDASGIEIKKSITKEEVEADFIKVCNNVGGIPSVKDIKVHGNYSYSTYAKMLGSFMVAANNLGINTEKNTVYEISEESLLSVLLDECNKLGRAPTAKEMSNMKYSRNAYMRKFGSYEAALKKIGHSGNKNIKVSSKCPICGNTNSTMISHVKKHHPDYLKKQEEYVVELFKSGLSNIKIANREDTIYNGGTSVARVIRKYLPKEQIEECRKNKISSTLEAEYSSGKYDWVSGINKNRNMSESGRTKSSDGLKKSYSDGKRDAWNKNLTKENNNSIKIQSESVSETIKKMYESGEIEKKIGPETNTWKEDRSQVSIRNRTGLSFSGSARSNIKKRAQYKCEECDITQKELKKNGMTLECDHIIPIYMGGSGDWESNGQCLCPECHKKKTEIDKERQSDEQNKQKT